MTRALALLLVLAASGCQSRGSAISGWFEVDNSLAESPAVLETEQGTLTVPPGGRAKASCSTGKQPTPSRSPATAIANERGAQASSGDAPDPPSTASAWIYLVLGTVLFLAGGILWLAKRKAVSLLGGAGGGAVAAVAAQLPKGTGLLVMGTGAGVAVLPWFLAEYGWIIGLAAGAVILTLVGKWLWNLRRAE